MDIEHVVDGGWLDETSINKPTTWDITLKSSYLNVIPTKKKKKLSKCKLLETPGS